MCLSNKVGGLLGHSSHDALIYTRFPSTNRTHREMLTQAILNVTDPSKLETNLLDVDLYLDNVEVRHAFCHMPKHGLRKTWTRHKPDIFVVSTQLSCLSPLICTNQIRIGKSC